jgi:hypothetical protein
MMSATPAPRMDEDRTVSHTLLWFIIALAYFRLCVMPLPSSLWLDETATYWVVQPASFAEAFSCAHDWYSQSLLYQMIVWLFRAIGGANEITLNCEDDHYEVWRLN